MRKTIRFCLLLLSAAGILGLCAFVTNQSANVVIGHQVFTSGSPNDTPAGAGTSDFPVAVNFDGTHFFICDNGNNRILVYNGIPTSNDAPANYVIGQPDLVSNQPNQGLSAPAANTLNNPNDVFSTGATLFVADTGNNRVLVYSPVPTSSNAPAQYVIGQGGFNTAAATITSTGLDTPEGVYASGTTLFVADTNNWRVLFYTLSPITSGEAAMLVLGSGSGSFVTMGAGSGKANELYNPQGVCAAGATLVVADSGNCRVLLYSPIPIASNTSAKFAVGQSGFGAGVTNVNAGGSPAANTLDNPAGVESDGTRLYIADTGNNRTLMYNAIPISSGANASTVMGQPDFVSTAANQGLAPSNQSESGPAGVFGNGTTLAIADTFNNRVLIYNSLPAVNDAPANTVLGQPDFASGAPNQATIADFMENPESIMVDSAGRLILADFTNNRVLIYNTVPVSNYAAANVVVGQPNFYSTDPGSGPASLDTPYGAYSDGTRLYVSDTSNNRVLIFSSIPATNGASASTVLGQTNFTNNQTNQGSGSCSPSSLWYPRDLWSNNAGTTLLVADGGNSRVLVFTNISSQFNAPAAVEIGETNMSDNTTGASTTSSQTLWNPWGVYYDGTYLIIGDTTDNRVMIYNGIPVTNNAPAAAVVGQNSFTGYNANQGGSPTSQGLNAPTGVNSDGTNLYVADEANNRILVYNNIASLPVSNASANVVLGQSTMTGSLINDGASSVNAQGLDAPNGVFVSSGNLFATDLNNNRALIFYPPTPTFTPTATPTNTPSRTPTSTPSNTSTLTPTNTPTNSQTNTPSSTSSSTPTYTASSTATLTATTTPTSTPLPSLGVNNASTNEGSPLNFIISLSSPSSQDVTFLCNTADGTAIGGINYTPIINLPVTILAGNTNALVIVNTIYTAAQSAQLNMTLTISNLSPGASIGVATGTGFINYIPPTSTFTPTDTPTNTPTNSPTNTPTDTTTNTPTNTATNTPTNTPTNTLTLTPTNTATSTATDSMTATPSLTATATPSLTPTKTATSTATNTPTNTPTVTPTNTATATATDSMTATPSLTASATPSLTPTKTATNTATNSPTATPTNTATATATNTPTNTSTNTATNTSTNSPTNSPTNTATSSPTATPTYTATMTSTFTPTNTLIPTNTPTASPTATPSATPSLTATFTSTRTPTFTPTITNTPTITSTFTPIGSLTATPTPNAALYLDENFFNPTQQSLGMDLRVDAAGEVKVVVFNIAGEEVDKLLDQNMTVGNYRVFWDGRNKAGDIIGNAVYFVVVEQPSGNMVRKVIVLK